MTKNNNYVKGENHYKRQKTHCPQNHEYSEENTWWYKGHRECKQCRRERNQKTREKNRSIKLTENKEKNKQIDKNKYINKTIERFKTGYIVNNNNCWIWNKSTDKDGYGKFAMSFPQKIERAHRASWVLYRGIIPENKCVLHKCDVTSCVNPEHLWLGTRDDNNKNMAIKERSRNQRTHSFKVSKQKHIKNSYKPIPTWNGPPRIISK